MSAIFFLYIILSGIVALLLALFQYRYKAKGNFKKNMLFAFLRFLSIFGVLLLLINPKFEQVTTYNEKPNLVVAVDNSKSISYLNQVDTISAIVEAIKKNAKLNKAFNVELFSFGSTLNPSNSLSFNEARTNIDKVFSELNQVYKNTTAPTILITDGNQTYGSDYEYAAKQYKQLIYPIIVGDTTIYSDLKIKQLNANKYAFLKNRFPIETIVVYNGDKKVNTKFVVTSGGKVVFSKPLTLSKTNNSQIINFTLPSNSVGIKTYRATVIPLVNEKNKRNNSRNFAVEVIDEKTNVAIVSSILHPDLGALKKSIESNEQRKVKLLKPSELESQLNEFQLVIIYQPNYSFKNLFAAIALQKKNKFIIAGPKTDWRFLNSATKNYKQGLNNQNEEYQAVLNTNYNTFIIDDLNFESFPPLESSFGDLEFSVPLETILYKKIGRIDTEEPLLATFETNGMREAILLGENIWKWRAQSFVNNKRFNTFDNFLGKLVQYLALNKQKDRLNVEYESFYLGNKNIIFSVQFFNKNYEFDTNENINITVFNKVSKQSQTIPLILKNNNYQVDLSSLPASDYSFTVKASSENISKSGSFKILEYNVEQQFLNANSSKLKRLAINSQGESYFSSNYEVLLEDLLTNNQFKPIQKSSKNIVPLIDWKYLLGLIALALALEWFLRKYNGLI